MTTRQIDIQHLPPASLQPNPWNTNRLDPSAEGKLENSILEFGIYKPVIVRELSDGTLQILGGEHRSRAAVRMGLPTVPVVNLGEVSDQRAKALGLADNGQYGHDDADKLAALLSELKVDADLMGLLPYTDEDLAGILASARIDLDDIGNLGDDLDERTLPEPEDAPARPSITHELMRFKVPVEDRQRVEELIKSVIKSRGLKAEQDSLIASGMALVEICNAARGQL